MFHVKQKLEQLRDFAGKANLPIDEDRLQKLIEYAAIIAEWNQRVHLISKSDVNMIIERHILPSLLFVKILECQQKCKDCRVLDLGTGAGLPGAVISIARPQWAVVLLDSNRKKTLFLKRIKSELDLNYEVICDRYENFEMSIEVVFNWIVARAVAPLGSLIRLVSGQLQKGTKLLTLKGVDFTEELTGFETNEYKISAWPITELVQNDDQYLKDKCLVSVERIYG